jgi:hypothetical protein
MKILKYNLLQSVTESGETILAEKTMSWSEANEENAKREAYKGEYTIEDDGQPEPEPVETTDDILNALLGVTV